MSNIFLDLGTHYGQGLREFVDKYQMDATWNIHTFEANPVTHDIFIKEHLHLTPWVISHHSAVSSFSGTLPMNLETPPNEGETGQGSSVISLDKWNPWGGGCHENFKRTVDVSCIDLSEFIRKHFVETDKIIVKMDIEGSEYDTLERLIETNVIDYIDEIYVEWHLRYFTNCDEIKVREEKIIEEITKRNIKLESWR
jgi:FkbM family methyltransferase